MFLFVCCDLFEKYLLLANSLKNPQRIRTGSECLSSDNRANTASMNLGQNWPVVNIWYRVTSYPILINGSIRAAIFRCEPKDWNIN